MTRPGLEHEFGTLQKLLIIIINKKKAKQKRVFYIFIIYTYKSKLFIYFGFLAFH